MTAIVAAPDPSIIVANLGEWCLVRWHGDSFCGPLSPVPGGVGFPSGGIGEILIFSTEEEAAALASMIEPIASAVRDLPTRLSDLHFSVREYAQGKERLLYDGGDFRWALLMAYARRGQLAPTPYAAKISIECRRLDAARKETT